MLTAAVVRDERVRAAFQVVGWVNLSQTPNLVALQQHLYEQLTGKKIPAQETGSVRLQVNALKRAAAGKVALVVCDDMYVNKRLR